jgi:peptidoglycan-N-acetylglucosamine deacetylase
MFYFVKTPKWLQFFFPTMTWEIKTTEKKIYLTFDDGPHPIYTHYVLDELKKYNAKATFFCIGKNVALFSSVYNRIIDEGHSVGNHTHNHIKGRSTKNEMYLQNIEAASNFIKSNLFRPPYGSIKKAQVSLLQNIKNPFKILMWTVLSGDFDLRISKEKCAQNVLSKTTKGSIVVFHDSEKAAEKMCFSLPLVLKHFSGKGYSFDKITTQMLI